MAFQKERASLAKEQQTHRNGLMASEQERHRNRIQQQQMRTQRHLEYLKRQEENEQKHQAWLKRQEEKEQKHREWLEREERRQAQKAAWEKRNAAWEKRNAAWQRHEAARAAQKHTETSENASTVASESGDDWNVPALVPSPREAASAPVVQAKESTTDALKESLTHFVAYAKPVSTVASDDDSDFDWAAPSAAESPTAPPAPVVQPKEPAPRAPVVQQPKEPATPASNEKITELQEEVARLKAQISSLQQAKEFTMDEWKELLKVKKVLREIAVIDDMLHKGKPIDALQAAKLQRRASLENAPVMYKDRLGYTKPSRHC